MKNKILKIKIKDKNVQNFFLENNNFYYYYIINK